MNDKPKLEPKALILLSGGIDSSTCMFLADLEYKGNTIGVSIDYGQRHKKEIESAKKICNWLERKHVTLEIQDMADCMLTNPETEIPNVDYSEISGVSPTYVPFRNGLLLSRVASYAQANDFTGIYFGAHAEDALNWAYPDCTPEFIGAMANAIYIGTYHQVRLHTPLEWLTKREIIKLGTKLGVPWQNTWSCYAGGNLHCGTCPTCRARHQGFIDAHIHDPTKYFKSPPTS